MTEPQMENQTPPQPGPNYSLLVQQEEIERLRTENNGLRNNNMFLTALYRESQDMVGSLLEQLSRDAPNPDAASTEENSES